MPVSDNILRNLAGFLGGAFALTGTAAQARPQPQDQSGWFSDIAVGAQLEAGILANSGHPRNGQNFGQLLPSFSDEPLLNQLALTVTKPVDPIGGGYGLGANLRVIYGSDARSYVIAGISDRWLKSRYQITPILANVALHLPWLTKEGVDGQIGILAAPMGIEVLDPSVRAFYSLAYVTQYSVPFEHVGGMFQAHLDRRFSVLFGVDTGNQTSFGRGDNNGRPAGYAGFSGSDLFGGALSFTYLFRVGPEDPVRLLGQKARSAQRFWNDLSATWRFSDRWSVSAELNQLHDEGLRADTWGAVAWAAWSVSSTVTVNARTELYRDNTGQFVVQYPGDRAYARTLLGEPAWTSSAPPTTYADLTLNAVWRPTIGHSVALFQLRPELRFDRSVNGTRPFGDFDHAGRILVGGDVTIGF